MPPFSTVQMGYLVKLLSFLLLSFFSCSFFFFLHLFSPPLPSGRGSDISVLFFFPSMATSPHGPLAWADLGRNSHISSTLLA
ncbi:hypothetical protein LX32DRAFT_192682 [Colletotrichum zoysiae]|uniref:Uncharacterized protein n=1 Tax=Colletotrichum zoysiae TaxID=1216348 RepID=A0AAD9LVB3_9PEZI|nr:hypothetical protein LX32DRAFT_192682 [Colletotrichum zoysiae]